MSDTTFHVRYRMTYAISLSDDPCAAPLRYPREWTRMSATGLPRPADRTVRPTSMNPMTGG